MLTKTIINNKLLEMLLLERGKIVQYLFYYQNINSYTNKICYYYKYQAHIDEIGYL